MNRGRFNVHSDAGISHMIAERPCQPYLGSAGMESPCKEWRAPCSLKVQTWIRHARPLVSCSMANLRLRELISPDYPQY